MLWGKNYLFILNMYTIRHFQYLIVKEWGSYWLFSKQLQLLSRTTVCSVMIETSYSGLFSGALVTGGVVQCRAVSIWFRIIFKTWRCVILALFP